MKTGSGSSQPNSISFFEPVGGSADVGEAIDAIVRAVKKTNAARVMECSRSKHVGQADHSAPHRQLSQMDAKVSGQQEGGQILDERQTPLRPRMRRRR